jgi:hypothetical protein
MLPQEAVWNTLRDADEALRVMIGPGRPSALHLWRKFFALRRRLSCDPPAGRNETVQRLRVIRDECTGDLTRFRPAVRRALNMAEQLEWQGRGHSPARAVRRGVWRHSGPRGRPSSPMPAVPRQAPAGRRGVNRHRLACRNAPGRPAPAPRAPRAQGRGDTSP